MAVGLVWGVAPDPSAAGGAASAGLLRSRVASPEISNGNTQLVQILDTHNLT